MHLFISYARPDRPHVESLVEQLKAWGHTVWWDLDLQPGVAYHQEIDRRLQAADRVIVIWSANSVASKWVPAEAEKALKRNVLVPVRIADVELPVPFNGQHTLQISTGPEREAQLRMLRKYLEKEARASEKSAAGPATAPSRRGALGAGTIAALALGFVYVQSQRGDLRVVNATDNVAAVTPLGVSRTGEPRREDCQEHTIAAVPVPGQNPPRGACRSSPPSSPITQTPQREIRGLGDRLTWRSSYVDEDGQPQQIDCYCYRPAAGRAR